MLKFGLDKKKTQTQKITNTNNHKHREGISAALPKVSLVPFLDELDTQTIIFCS
jgi:hypothetical protein